VNKKILITVFAFILVLVLLPACGGDKETSAPTGKYEIIRRAVLGGKWQMYQFRLKLPLNGEFDIDLLDLMEGDRVDGYFYPEKSTGVSLEITAGTNMIYSSMPSNGGTSYDRFSFSASQPSGMAYVLLFKNVGTDKEISVFVEVIYPATARIRGPLDLK